MLIAEGEESKQKKSGSRFVRFSKTIIIPIFAFFLSIGGAALIYDWWMESHKLKGEILNVNMVHFHEGYFDPERRKDSMSPTLFHVFIYLTNRYETPVHINKYGFYIDVGDGKGFEKLDDFIMKKEINDISVRYDKGQWLEIRDIKEKLLLNKKSPIVEGEPYYGIGQFISPRPKEYFKENMTRIKYRLTIEDGLGVHYTIESNPNAFISPKEIGVRFDIGFKFLIDPSSPAIR